MAKVIAVVTQINGNGTAAVADVSYSLDTIAFSASIQVSLSTLTSQADVVEIIKNAVLTDVNTRGIGTYTYSDIILVSTGATGSFGRDVIVSSKVTSGNSDFFSVSSLTLTLEADSTDPFIYDIGGVQFKQTADITLAVTDNAHNFIWINNLGAMGRVATPCTYSFTAPGAPATGDMWYDLGKQQMKEWSGSAWVAVFRIMIGYVRADSGSINARYVCAPIGVTPEARFAAFGPGTDGFLDVSSGTTTIDHSKFYTAVVVRGSGTVVHTTGVSVALRVKSQECIALVGTSGIDLSGRGRPAGNGQTGTASGGAGNALGGAGGGGGGGTNAGGAGGNRNDASAFVGTGQGTAGGAGGGTGGNGTASPLDSTDGDTIYQFGQGGGGGGGGGDNTSAGGNGGRGGGNGSFFSPTIAIGASATMNANGGNGTAGGGANRGGGGAGGGGIIQAICRNFFNSGTFSANSGTVGASGGAGSGAGGSGGAGVAALVRV